VAFTSFVSGGVDKLGGAAGAAGRDHGRAGAEGDLGGRLSIWKAYHDASKERRDAIMSEWERLE
jgi:hypothetical protein